jgi:hypothetical protein
MDSSGFQLRHKTYSGSKSEVFFFIGGSTMEGKGISGSAYPGICANFSDKSISVHTKYLIKLSEAIEIIQKNKISGTIFLNCGAGDQLRLINPLIGWLFPRHWSFPSHMEPPINFSTRYVKRYHQKFLIFIKYLVKKILRYGPLYKNSTSIEQYERQLKTLIQLSNEQSLRIIWIETALGDFKIPEYIKEEKRRYCKELVLINVHKFYAGSEFLSIEGLIDQTDLLSDGFHLNDIGHSKLANLILDKYF